MNFEVSLKVNIRVYKHEIYYLAIQSVLKSET